MWSQLWCCEAVWEFWLVKGHVISCDLMSPQHDYEATKSWYRNLARDHRDLVRYNASIGKSVEGRDMPAVHITANHNSGRKKIYFQCQIHARELYVQSSTLASYPGLPAFWFMISYSPIAVHMQ